MRMMKTTIQARGARRWIWPRLTLLLALAGAGIPGGRAEVVFEATSPYHHIRVVDEQGRRTLSFDGSMETRMSLTNPLTGHFEYTEYFHQAWLWHPKLSRVLMLGLGGGSVQRAFQHYYPEVKIDTVELDPVVIRVARDYFGVEPTERHQIHTGDGRVFLNRSREEYDLIILDAYTSNRYGSYIPHQLVTREFFTLAAKRLSASGVLAYNVIGQVNSAQRDVTGSVYRTLKAVFPQVYLFPARSSRNVVFLATRDPQLWTLTLLQARLAELTQAGRQFPPAFAPNLRQFRLQPPASAVQARVLTDDFAPVNGLLSVGY